MDPNTALQSILSGHLIADHAEALRDWLRSGGFLPDPILSPADCHVAFGAWNKDALVSATAWGLITSAGDSMRWEDVLKLDDSEY